MFAVGDRLNRVDHDELAPTLSDPTRADLCSRMEILWAVDIESVAVFHQPGASDRAEAMVGVDPEDAVTLLK